jgi:hypothetical protein
MRWNAAKLALAMVVGLAGCATHHGYYEGGGRWSDGEVVYYNQWEVETHRQHVDYAQRKEDEQRAYWSWRQNHHDHDNDHH